MLANTREVVSLLTPVEKRKFYLLLVSSIVTGLLQAVSVVSLMPFIQMAMEPDSINEPGFVNILFKLFDFANETSFLIFLGVIVLALILISGIASAFTTWLQYSFVWGNNYTISRRLLANYLNQPYEFFINRSSADFTKNILDEVNIFTQQYLMNFINLIVGIAVTISVIFMLVLVDPIIALVGMFVIGGAYSLIFISFRALLKNIGTERLECNKIRFGAVSEAFGGIKDIKLLGNESYFLDGYSGAAGKHAKLISKTGLISTLPKYLFETVAFGCMVILVLYILSKGGDITSTIPLIAVFAFAAYRILPQLQMVYNAITQTKFYSATVSNIKKELEGAVNSDETLSFQGNRETTLPFQDVVQLSDISYCHPMNTKDTLSEISLSISKKDSIGIVGATGAGKTTLVDIFLGLLIPQRGAIRVDGIEVNDENRREWQNNLGYVPQFIYLSDSTVTRNIAFGVPDKLIDPDKVKKAATIANIDDFIEHELPNGYDTIVGERGIRLSGGQRQRIGIARALYRDPEVLVLDEATSSLDGVTEKSFIDALADLSGVKTLLVIAHRFNTIRECDRIYVMEKGRIIAQGSYDELMEKEEKFRKMANQ